MPRAAEMASALVATDKSHLFASTKGLEHLSDRASQPD